METVLGHYNADDFASHLQEMLDDGSLRATADGVWVNCEDVNPATGQVEDKHFWLVEHDGRCSAPAGTTVNRGEDGRSIRLPGNRMVGVHGHPGGAAPRPATGFLSVSESGPNGRRRCPVSCGVRTTDDLHTAGRPNPGGSCGRIGSMPTQRNRYSRRTYAFPEDFPQRLRRFQEESGLSWSDIDRRLETCRHNVWRWASGRTLPNHQHRKALVELADSMGLGHIFSD